MRVLNLFFYLIICITTASSQMLLENKEGDSQFIPIIPYKSNNSGLLKLNTGDESLGIHYFDVIDSTRDKYKLLGLGLKSKPTEGYAAVFNNGQFSPGITIGASLTQVKVFDRVPTKPENNFIDWAAVYFNYSLNKYNLFQSDTLFESQLYSEIFHGIEVGINYNILLKSKFLIGLKFGFAMKNNYGNLDEIEVKDIKSYFDPISGTTRQSSTTTSAKKGKYDLYNAFPVTLSFTKLTSDDPDIKGYRAGYNIYLKTSFIDDQKTSITSGCILFLAKNKDGISTPLLGLNFEFDDLFNALDSDNDLFYRLNIGLTSSISF